MKGDNFSEKARSDKVVASGKEKDLLFKDSKAVAEPPLKRGAATAPQSETKKRKLKMQTAVSRENQAVNAPKDNSGNSGTAPKLTSNRTFRLKPDSNAPSSPIPTIEIKSKLTDRQSNKLKRLERRADKKEQKYFKRDKKLPKRHALKLTEKQGNGKRKVKLHFEEQTKAQKEDINVLKAPRQALKQGIDRVVQSTTTALLDGGEHEQSSEEKQIRGLTGKTVDTAVGTVKSVVTAPARFLNWRTERKYKKLEKAKGKAVKANTKLEYKTFRFESKANYKANPLENKKPTSNPFSKALQKRRFAKNYRKSLKERSRKVGRSLVQMAVKAINFVTSHIKKIGLIALVIFLIMTLIGSCMQGLGVATTGVFKGIFSTTYPADDEELSNADWYISDLEAGLADSIEKAEQNHPNYDEYNYFLNGSVSDKQSLIASLWHDPFAFLSFISVMHEDFTFTEIQGDLQEFFNVMFQLDLETVTETRYRTVNNDDGTTSQEAYTYYILNTKLTVADFETVIQPYLASKEGERQYDEYIGTGGNHQMFGSPFNFNWSGIITCQYGGRDNPTGANTGSTTASGQEMHTGLDIGVGIGTPIYSVMEGTVTFAGWHNLYGNYVDVTDSNGNKSRYAHCDSLNVVVGQKILRGQLLALSGKTGNVTGPHLHIEIFLAGTRVNPVFLIARKPTADNED